MSIDRLTDEQMVKLRQHVQYSGLEDAITMSSWVDSLVREVQECRALRPDCPTCGGSSEQVVTQPGMGETIHAHIDCPDCTDGKMPLDKWMALLVETLRHCADWFKLDLDDGCPACPEDAIDTVLKMVPK